VVGLERAGRSNCVIDAGGVFQGVLTSPFFGVPWTEAKCFRSRRCSKNSGGGIAPAAIGGLIEGAFCTVNAFRPPRKAEKGGENGA
jgi:hypothetical protein